MTFGSGTLRVGTTMTDFSRVIPVLRIFSIEKAREFYLDYLGFRVDWKHRFEPSLPLYMQVSRGQLVLHLTEHHGDCTPGARVFVVTTGVIALHQELHGKAHGYSRPGLENEPWGTSVTVTDPFQNRIAFNEYADNAATTPASP